MSNKAIYFSNNNCFLVFNLRHQRQSSSSFVPRFLFTPERNFAFKQQKLLSISKIVMARCKIINIHMIWTTFLKQRKMLI